MVLDEDQIDRVWNKGRQIPGKDPNVIRQDQCSTPIKRDEYGNRDSQYGWEIDHIDPKGSDDISNLQPLQWENNVGKSDGKLRCKCSDE